MLSYLRFAACASLRVLSFLPFAGCASLAVLRSLRLAACASLRVLSCLRFAARAQLSVPRQLCSAACGSLSAFRISARCCPSASQSPRVVHISALSTARPRQIPLPRHTVFGAAPWAGGEWEVAGADRCAHCIDGLVFRIASASTG
ncbi:hypothetical protein GCM10023107_44950 [Actinoplanes octamycinicus]|nr:hypothetical protein Aoc01nite_41570 [Actinoplanes octamycinicus]